MKHTIELFKQGRYHIISERMMEVDDQVVSSQIKKGREVLTCSCENSGTFGQNQMCRHKRFFIAYPFLERHHRKLENLRIYYEGARQLKKEIKPEIVLETLKDLE